MLCVKGSQSPYPSGKRYVTSHLRRCFVMERRAKLKLKNTDVSGKLRDVVIGAAVIVVGYLGFALGNALGHVILLLTGLSLMLRVVGPLLSGFVVGLLVRMIFPARSVLLGFFLALVPIVFSWFIRGAHTFRARFRYVDGEIVPSPNASFQQVYSDLAIMLIVAGLSSIVAQKVWHLHTIKYREGRTDADRR